MCQADAAEGHHATPCGLSPKRHEPGSPADADVHVCYQEALMLAQRQQLEDQRPHKGGRAGVSMDPPRQGFGIAEEITHYDLL